jgi:hypothetical protein
VAAAPFGEQDGRVVEFPAVVFHDRRHQPARGLVQGVPPGVGAPHEVDEPAPAELPVAGVAGLDHPVGVQQQAVAGLQVLDALGDRHAQACTHGAGRIFDGLFTLFHNRVGYLLSVPASHSDRALDLGATWFREGEERVRTLTVRSGIETFDQHLAGDPVLQDTTGARRLAGSLVDAPSHRFATGSQSLAAGLPTATLRLNTPVTTLQQDGQGRLTVIIPAGALHAGHVVLAVPPALAVERVDFGDPLPGDLLRLAKSTPVWTGAVGALAAGERAARAILAAVDLPGSPSAPGLWTGRVHRLAAGPHVRRGYRW